MEDKICKYSKCGKQFTPNHGKQLYCSPNCKAYDFLKNKQVKKVVLVDCEDGNFLFMNPDGTTRKCTLVWEDLITEVVPDKTEVIVPVTLPKKMPPVPDIKIVTNEPKYNFGDAKFLVIEKFTEYPIMDKPTNKFEAAAWLKKKAAADAKIKEAWNNRDKI